MAKKKSKSKDDKRKSKKRSRLKDRKKSKKSSGRTKKKIIRKKKGKTKKGKKKKGKKRPKGPSWGPKPVDPATGKPKKKWPKKKPKKWPPKKKRPSGTDGDSVESDLLQFSDFATHVETFFNLADFDPSIPIELIEVAELDSLDIPDELDGEVRTRPFSVRFLAPVNVELVQGVYTVEHVSMETMVLLLVPIGPPVSDGEFQIILEAIFA